MNQPDLKISLLSNARFIMRLVYALMPIVLLDLLSPAFAAQECNADPRTTPNSRFLEHEYPITFTNSDYLIEDTATGLIWSKCALGQSGSACGTGSPQSYSLVWR